MYPTDSMDHVNFYPSVPIKPQQFRGHAPRPLGGDFVTEQPTSPVTGPEACFPFFSVLSVSNV